MSQIEKIPAAGAATEAEKRRRNMGASVHKDDTPRPPQQDQLCLGVFPGFGITYLNATRSTGKTSVLIDLLQSAVRDVGWWNGAHIV